jgi:hypothetical protein
METTRSSETSVYVRTTVRYIAEDVNIDNIQFGTVLVRLTNNNENFVKVKVKLSL